MPYDTYFDEDKILAIKQLKEIEIIEGSVKQYFNRTDDDDYLLSADVQEEGEHYNSICVINIPKNRIEATLLTRMPIYDILLELSKYYTNISTNEQAKIMIERNRGFYLLKKFEENNLNYLILPNIRYIKKTDSYEFDLDEEGNPFKLGFITTDSKRKKMLITLANFIYKNDELPYDLVDEAQKFVYKGHGKPVGLEHDDLLFATAIGLFTLEILAIAKGNKSNRNLQKFIREY